MLKNTSIYCEKYILLDVEVQIMTCGFVEFFLSYIFIFLFFIFIYLFIIINLGYKLKW